MKFTLCELLQLASLCTRQHRIRNTSECTHNFKRIRDVVQHCKLLLSILDLTRQNCVRPLSSLTTRTRRRGRGRGVELDEAAMLGAKRHPAQI